MAVLGPMHEPSPSGLPVPVDAGANGAGPSVSSGGENVAMEMFSWPSGWGSVGDWLVTQTQRKTVWKDRFRLSKIAF